MRKMAVDEKSSLLGNSCLKFVSCLGSFFVIKSEVFFDINTPEIVDHKGSTCKRKKKCKTVLRAS